MRRLFPSFALAVSLAALYASPALARPGHHHKRKSAPEGAQKAPLFGETTGLSLSCENGTIPTPETVGFAILNTPGDETTLSGEVALKGAEPNTTYEVGAFQSTVNLPPPITCVNTGTVVGTITTNKEGNGNLQFTVARTPGTTKFLVTGVATTQVVGTQFFGSPAVELD